MESDLQNQDADKQKNDIHLPEQTIKDHKEVELSFLSSVKNHFKEPLTGNQETGSKVDVVNQEFCLNEEHKDTSLEYVAEKAVVSHEDVISEDLNTLMRKKNAPTGRYASEVGVYEWSGVIDEGNIVYTKSAMDHFVSIVAGYMYWFDDNSRMSLRKKGSVQETWENIEGLGLQDVFSKSNDTDSILEKIDDYTDGVLLDDLLRKKDREYIGQFDVEVALKTTASYIRMIHTQGTKGVGELLTSDILLKVTYDEQTANITGARITLPDSLYRPNVAGLTQKAIDILELCFSLSSAALANGEHPGKYARIFLKEYNTTGTEKALLHEVLQLLKRGFPRSTFFSRRKYRFDRLQDKKKSFKEVRRALRVVFEKEIYYSTH